MIFKNMYIDGEKSLLLVYVYTYLNTWDLKQINYTILN